MRAAVALRHRPLSPDKDDPHMAQVKTQYLVCMLVKEMIQLRPRRWKARSGDSFKHRCFSLRVLDHVVFPNPDK